MLFLTKVKAYKDSNGGVRVRTASEMCVLVRSHLLCPYSDCVAHYRKGTPRVYVLLDEERAVSLKKDVTSKIAKTRLPYLNKLWVRLKECPHCNRPLEVVVDETHNGRNIYLRIPKK